jgi:hypothetical protein
MNIFKNILVFTNIALVTFSSTYVFAQGETKNIAINFNNQEIDPQGYYTYTLPLKHDILPSVQITSVIADTLNNNIPNINVISNSFEPDIILNTNRKQHLVTLKIPAYIKANGNIIKLNAIEYAITQPDNYNTKNRQIFANNSVLATGNWYKIAIKNRGVYKIDYNFLTSIGINPSQVNPNHIRIYGNGGKIMGEKVASDNNLDDLVENAIYVRASGNTFTTNDYVLFYADGPITWKYNTNTNKFEHTNNIYDDYSYYFINTDIGLGKRIGNYNSVAGTPDVTINTFDNYYVHDIDSFTISELGRVWFSNRMNINNSSSLTQNINVNLFQPVGDIHYTSVVAHNNNGSGQVSLSINNSLQGSVNLWSVNSDNYEYYHDGTFSGNYNTNGSSNLNFQYKYSASTSGSAYIDYIRINYQSHLSYNNSQFNFRSTATTTLSNNQIAKYVVQNANNIQIWNVTDNLNPIAINFTTQNNNAEFQVQGNALNEFTIFHNNNLATPIFIEKVENQNLHALTRKDLIIITHPNFIKTAEDFAVLKKNLFNQSSEIVTVDKIYNEFGSGTKDITAIRNFIKMYYDRAYQPEEVPNGVLLIGNASYDFKNRVTNNTNFVPGYQSKASYSNNYAYMTDDYLGILDDGEDINAGNSMLDIAIGRWPINTQEEGAILIEKYKTYHSKASFGPWKNDITYVADDRDYNNSFPGMNHLADCEAANNYFFQDNESYNIYKIYADAYKKEITSAGVRFPQVNKALNDKVLTGTLYLSYSGHGSPSRWAHEAILSNNEFSKWNNINKLPFIFTGTCDFSRFDNPSIKAAGVELFKRKEGGAIGLISTTQIVYNTANTNLSKSITSNMFTKIDGTYQTVGEVIRKAKNENVVHFSNNLNYALLADPTMKLQIPELNVVTDKIYNISSGEAVATDTLQSLGKYVLEAHISDENNNLMSNFNGIVYISIFDKKINLLTIQGPNQPTPQFTVQNNILTKITASVENGKIRAEFIVPKDIIFDYGSGKISYYANSNQQEAKGYTNEITVGGIDKNASANDNKGPIVKAYIDDEKFKDGSITGANPMLYATIKDDLGINVSGSSLGHDLVAILDGDESNPFVMNSFYNSNLNDFTSGYVKFPFSNLPEGKHIITVRAWDIHNNSGEGNVHFEVKNPEKGFIGEVYNYPNPFSQTTNFVVQHNQEGKNLKIKIKIFNTSGMMIGYTEKEHIANENRSIITWDGTTLNGRPLESGLYFYNLSIETEDGRNANINQKLVFVAQ